MPGYCRRAVHTRFCTVLLVTVPQFCAPLYGNSVVKNAPGHFCRIFLRPVCPQTVKKDCVFRRGGNNLNRFGLRLEIPCRYSRNTPVQKTPVIISEIFGNDGGTMVAAPPFFETAHRGTQQFWGTGTGAAVVLWDTLTEEERDAWGQESATRRDWILVRRPPKKGQPQQGEQRSEPPGHIILRLKKNGKKPDPRRGGDEKPSRGRAFRERGWWSRGAIEATLNEHGLECWVHEDVKRRYTGRRRFRNS